MKDLESNIEETCIEFGKFVTATEDWTASTDYMAELWKQFQEQQAKKVLDILDDITDKTDISDTIDNFKISIDGLDEQLQIAREVQGILDIINTVQSQVSKHTDIIESLTKICKKQESQIKALNNIVSANEIALNNLEK